MASVRKQFCSGLSHIAILLTAVFAMTSAAFFVFLIPDMRTRLPHIANTQIHLAASETPHGFVSPSTPVHTAQQKNQESFVARVLPFIGGNDARDVVFNAEPPSTSSSAPLSPFASVEPFASFAPAQRPIQKILISEIQIGDAASAQHEFVELYNPNAYAVDLGGWELRKKTSGGTDSVLVSGKKFTGTITSHGYFLIAHPDYAAVIHADATWSGQGYAIANDNSVYLTDADGRIIDLVGFGSAYAYEGSAAQNPEVGVTLARISEQDSDNNRADFAFAVSSPRTVQSGSGFFVPARFAPTHHPVLSPSPVFSASPAPTVYASLSPVPTSPPDSTPSPMVNPSPSLEISPSPVFNETPSPTPIVSQKILITEVLVTGNGASTDDFIELYNPNSETVNLKGYRLVKRTQTDVRDYSIKSWTGDVILAPHAFHVWANSGYAELAGSANSTTTATLANDNAVALRFGALDSGQVIDSVGWGGYGGALCETVCVTENPGAGESLMRTGFHDTNNNVQDFENNSVPSPGR